MAGCAGSTSYSQGDIQTALGWVEAALLRVPRLLAGVFPWEVLRDSVTHHAWLENAPACLCGGVARESVGEATWTELPLPCPTTSELTFVPVDGSLVDVYRAKASALRHAFEACLTVLAVGTIVHT